MTLLNPSLFARYLRMFRYEKLVSQDKQFPGNFLSPCPSLKEANARLKKAEARSEESEIKGTKNVRATS